MKKLTVTEERIYRVLQENDGAYLSAAEISRWALNYVLPDAVDCNNLLRAHLSNMRRKGVPIVCHRAVGWRLGTPGETAPRVLRTSLRRCAGCPRADRYASLEEAKAAGWAPGAKGWFCPACWEACRERNAEAAARLAAWRERNRIEAREAS